MEHFLGKEEVIGSIPIVGLLVLCEFSEGFLRSKNNFQVEPPGKFYLVKDYERYYTVGVY